ncbi:hypothetical protein GN956_G12564 [Arapaima gigas]
MRRQALNAHRAWIHKASRNWGRGCFLAQRASVHRRETPIPTPVPPHHVVRCQETHSLHTRGWARRCGLRCRERTQLLVSPHSLERRSKQQP